MKNQTKSARKSIHISNLSKTLGLSVEMTCELYKHLKRIETDGHRLAEKYCNGEIDSTQIEELEKRLKTNLNATLKYAKSDVVRNIQFNWDPRGYFLKINDDFVRQNKIAIQTDWGGYGILCPEGV